MVCISKEAETISADIDIDSVSEVVEVTSLKSLLNNYQRTIRQLISLPTCSGVSLHDLERFRQEFRAAAFTCCLPSCWRSVEGFEALSFLVAHESSHRRILCEAQGCLYPPFANPKALQRHQRKYHDLQAVNTKRKVIREAPMPPAGSRSFRIMGNIKSLSPAALVTDLEIEEVITQSSGDTKRPDMLSKLQTVTGDSLLDSFYLESPCPTPDHLEIPDIPATLEIPCSSGKPGYLEIQDYRATPDYLETSTFSPT